METIQINSNVAITTVALSTLLSGAQSHRRPCSQFWLHGIIFPLKTISGAVTKAIATSGAYHGITIRHYSMSGASCISC